MKARVIGLLAVLVAVCGLCPQGARAAARPVMRGTILNFSTTAHRPVAHLPVALEVRRNGRVLSLARGRTDALGAFALAAPPLPIGGSYAVITSYRGVIYGVAVPAERATQPFEVPVYDTTATDTGLIAPRVIVAVRRDQTGLTVMEQWTLTNPTVYTAVGGAMIPLPVGATNAAVLPGSGSQAVPASVARGAILVNTVLRPATGLNAASLPRVTFTFFLPVMADHPTLTVPTRYLIGGLNVLSLSARLVAPGFKQAALTLDGRRVPTWQTEAVPAGSVSAIGVDGPPAAAPSQVGGSAPPRVTAFPTASVAAIVAGGFGLLFLLGLVGRAGAFRTLRTLPRRLALRREQTRLIDVIAQLDVRYARGALPEGDYRRQRAEDKNRLVRVTEQLDL